jgi:tetratricopeptide (TPR) repeat protein
MMMPPTSASGGWRRPALAAATLLGAMLVTLVYLPGIGGGFVFDDFANLVENPALHVRGLAWQDWVNAVFSSVSGPIQRPVAMLSFALNHYFTGMAAPPMKFTNILIHAANFALLFGLLRHVLRLGTREEPRADWIALLVALAWALHPINLTAVLYVVQRMESLCHAFVFAGLWAYASGRSAQLAGRAGWPRVLGGLVLGTGLGALTKESALLLPLYAFILELCVFRFRVAGDGADRRLLGLYLAVLVVPGVLGAFVVVPNALEPGSFFQRRFNLEERLMTEGRVVLDYLQWTLLPDLRQLSLFHDDYVISRSLMDPPATLWAFIAIAALLATAWWLRSRRPLVALGLLWFFAAHTMTATIVPLELVFEHRNYFASAGLLLAFADLALGAAPGRGRRLGALVAVLFVAYCGILTHLRAREWSEPVRFAMTEAAKHPRSARATYLHASNLVRLTGFRADSPLLPEAWRALERAREAPYSNSLPLQASLILAARTGAEQREEWWAALEHQLRTQPLTSENRLALVALNNCAVEEACDFPRERMLSVFSAALSQGPDSGMLSVFGKYALHVMKDYPLALRLWRESVRHDDRKAIYRTNLAELCIVLGRYDEAQVHVDALRRLGALDQHAEKANELQSDLRRVRAWRQTRAPAHGR